MNFRLRFQFRFFKKLSVSLNENHIFLFVSRLSFVSAVFVFNASAIATAPVSLILLSACVISLKFIDAFCLHPAFRSVNDLFSLSPSAIPAAPSSPISLPCYVLSIATS